MHAGVTKGAVSGWAMQLLGTALWLYGYYLTVGHTALIDWHAHAPWWIADFLPNLECEVGAAVTIAALVPLYWPARR